MTTANPTPDAGVSEAVPSPTAGIEIQAQIAHSVEVSAGPLPHPEFFGAYEAIVPGAGERILKMAETQQLHRHGQQSVRLNADISLEARGQWMAFLIAMAGVIGGITLIALDKSLAGFATLLSAIAAIAGLFIWSKRRGTAASPSDSAQPGEGMGLGREAQSGDYALTPPSPPPPPGKKASSRSS